MVSNSPSWTVRPLKLVATIIFSGFLGLASTLNVTAQGLSLDELIKLQLQNMGPDCWFDRNDNIIKCRSGEQNVAQPRDRLPECALPELISHLQVERIFNPGNGTHRVAAFGNKTQCRATIQLNACVFRSKKRMNDFLAFNRNWSPDEIRAIGTIEEVLLIADRIRELAVEYVVIQGGPRGRTFEDIYTVVLGRRLQQWTIKDTRDIVDGPLMRLCDIGNANDSNLEKLARELIRDIVVGRIKNNL